MHAKTILALLFLVSVAIAAAVFVRALPSQSGARTSVNISSPAREILVATVPLAAGTVLRAHDVSWWAPSADAPYVGEILRPAAEKREAKPEIDEEARGEVRGAALRTDVASGAPVLRGNLVKPGERDFLRVVLAPGSRAILIPLAAGGGLLHPGDRVDVILTQTFKNDAPPARRTVGETIADDVRVLVVEGLSGKADGGTSSPRTVTLDVSREQAEKINVANELGKLSLTLRGGGEVARAADNAQAAVKPNFSKPTWAGDVSPALAGTAPLPESVPEHPPVQIFHGTTRETVKP
jgi:pilus assembly protein CpaB